MMRRLNHHRAEMKKKILEEQMQGNHQPVKPQNMVKTNFNFRFTSGRYERTLILKQQLFFSSCK